MTTTTPGIEKTTQSLASQQRRRRRSMIWYWMSVVCACICPAKQICFVDIVNKQQCRVLIASASVLACHICMFIYYCALTNIACILFGWESAKTRPRSILQHAFNDHNFSCYIVYYIKNTYQNSVKHTQAQHIQQLSP